MKTNAALVSRLAADPDAPACPFCGQTMALEVTPLTGPLWPHLERLARGRLPGWTPERGLCPDCALRLAREAQHWRSAHSLQDELLVPYPVYAPEPAELLPAGLRVRASQVYAGRGVTIAFIDSGFFPHPDFLRPRNRIRAYVDASLAAPFVQRLPRQRHPSAWHGLMVAGVGAGSGYQSDGRFAGLAPEADLVLVKTGNRRVRRRIAIGDRDIARALAWVIAHAERYHIRIVNLSLGGDYPSTGAPGVVDEVVAQAVERGLLVVAAAGNGGSSEIMAPASAWGALTVGSLDDQNTLDRRHSRPHNSNFGRGEYGALKPDLLAPGRWLAAPMLPQTWVHNEAIYLLHLLHESDEALARHLAGPVAEKRFKKDTLRLPLEEVRRTMRRRIIEMKFVHPHYQHVDGTSMAAPIVSGLAAQMLEANPSLTPAQLKQALCATADPLPHVARPQQGAGVVNGSRAIAAARRLAGGPLAGLGPSPQILEDEIRLSYYDPAAQQVSAVGTFNGWQPQAGVMTNTRPGLWEISLPRRPGRHAYRFLVDGLRWLRDPENPELEEDGRGDYHSVVEL